MVGLVKERNSWREKFEQGYKPECTYLRDYRLKRNSEYWRISRRHEELCEYIIWLEDKLEKEN